MYKPTFDKKLKPIKEKTAIIEYCIKNWTIKGKEEEFENFVNFVFDYGTKMGINKFNESEFNRQMNNLVSKDFERMTEQVSKGKTDALELYYQKRSISYAGDDIKKHTRDEFSYNQFMPDLLEVVSSKFNGMNDVKPKHWEKYKKNRDKVDNMTEQFEKDFKGSKATLENGHSFNFVDNISCSNIEYNKEKDRDVLESLVSGILNQGYALKVHNNTVEITQQIDKIFENKNSKIKLDSIESKNKLVIVMLELALLEVEGEDKIKNKNKEQKQQKILSQLKTPNWKLNKTLKIKRYFQVSFFNINS